MTDIRISHVSDDPEGYVFDVEVDEVSSSTKHRVALSRSDYEELTDANISPEVLVEKSFKFLLEREPKESILSEFDLREISRYFPEYEEEAKGFS